MLYNVKKLCILLISQHSLLCVVHKKVTLTVYIHSHNNNT